jgi:hypothetical protein
MRFSIHSHTPRLLERWMDGDPHFEHTKNRSKLSVICPSLAAIAVNALPRLVD